MIKSLKRSFKNIRNLSRPLISIQVEPTSICQHNCTMCPRTIFKDWENGKMDRKTFQAISNIFPLTKGVHLQGWGEPLLHPDFFKMAEKASDFGCKVTFTTNGSLLNSKNIDLVFKSNIDTIAISFAGSTNRTHERIRLGSSFDSLITSINEIITFKKRYRINKPRIVLSYLMLTSNIAELPDFIQLGSQLSVNEIVATNLDFVPHIDQKNESIITTKNLNLYETILKEIEEFKKDMKIKIRIYPVEPRTCIVCELNPIRFAYINWKGEVSPCVYLNLPKKGLLRRYFLDQEKYLQPVVFGNVNRESFLEIWRKASYVSFRKAFERRLMDYRNLKNSLGVDYYSISRLESAEKRFREKLAKNPLPDHCKTCYKAYGL